jgi:hypothetical protein
VILARAGLFIALYLVLNLGPAFGEEPPAASISNIKERLNAYRTQLSQEFDKISHLSKEENQILFILEELDYELSNNLYIFDI